MSGDGDNDLQKGRKILEINRNRKKSKKRGVLAYDALISILVSQTINSEFDLH